MSRRRRTHLQSHVGRRCRTRCDFAIRNLSRLAISRVRLRRALAPSRAALHVFAIARQGATDALRLSVIRDARIRIGRHCRRREDAHRTAVHMRVMGDSWARLRNQSAARTQRAPSLRAHGYLRIEHGRRPLARVLARMLRLPRPNAAAETRLIVTSSRRWRTLAADIQRAAPRHAAVDRESRESDSCESESRESELAERFGILELRFRLDASGRRPAVCSASSGRLVRVGSRAHTQARWRRAWRRGRIRQARTRQHRRPRHPSWRRAIDHLPGHHRRRGHTARDRGSLAPRHSRHHRRIRHALLPRVARAPPRARRAVCV